MTFFFFCLFLASERIHNIGYGYFKNVSLARIRQREMREILYFAITLFVYLYRCNNFIAGMVRWKKRFYLPVHYCLLSPSNFSPGDAIHFLRR